MNKAIGWRQKLINPVLDKEFRLRMRTIKSPLSLLCYLLVIGFIAMGSLYLNSGFGMNNAGFNPSISQEMFYFLSFVQLALIAFMTPGLTAGVISGEREKQTLNILLTTQQSSTTIILSKLVSSLSFMLLVTIATLPVYSIVFLYGGISPSQLAFVFAFYVFIMIMIGAFGVLFSTLFKRTIISVIVTYGFTAFIFGGTAIIYIFFLGISQEWLYQASATTMPPYSWVGYIAGLNPIAALLSIFESDLSDQAFLANNGPRGSSAPISLWLEFLLVYFVLTIGAILLSIRLIRPSFKKRGKRKQLDVDWSLDNVEQETISSPQTDSSTDSQTDPH